MQWIRERKTFVLDFGYQMQQVEPGQYNRMTATCRMPSRAVYLRSSDHVSLTARPSIKLVNLRSGRPVGHSDSSEKTCGH